MNSRSLAVSLMVASTLTVSACTAPAPSTSAPGAEGQAQAIASRSVSTFVKGKATLGSPLVGARVQFFDATGALWKEAPTPTSASGTFAFRAIELVGKNIRVRVTGGTVDGKPFTGVLETALDGFNPALDLVYCNPATTVASALLRLKGGTASDAAERVRRYFALPTSMNLGPSVDNPRQTFFSEAQFLKEAGGLDGFDVNALRVAGEVASAAEGAKTTRYRAAGRSVLQATTWGDLASSLWKSGGKAAATEIGKGALSAVGGAIMTSALGALGLDPATNQRKEIINQLKQISGKIDQLSADVHNLQASVDTLKDDVQALAGKVDQVQNSVDALAFRTARDTALLAYDNAITGDFRQAKALIDARWDVFSWQMDHVDELTHDDLTQLVADTDLPGLQNALTLIHQASVGDLGTTPLMTLWGRVVGFNETALGGYPYIASDRYLNAVRLVPDQVLSTQWRGTLLISEMTALRGQLAVAAGTPVSNALPLAAQQAWDNFGTRVVAQRDKVWTAGLAPKDIGKVVYSPINGLLWARTPQPIQYTRPSGFPTFTTNGYGTFVVDSLLPAPSSLSPTYGVDPGNARGWRWPTAVEAKTLGRRDDRVQWPKLTDAGFQFGNVPVNEAFHFWTQWQFQYAPDTVAGSAVMYTSSTYGDGTPVGIDLSNYVSTAAPIDSDYGWYYLAKIPTDPWRYAAVVYVPVNDFAVDPVAGEFTRFW